VHGVVNRITVTAPRVDPEKIRDEIEEALERRAERDARDIQIEVDDAGVVSLSGHVHSWRDKRAVVGAASHAPGVKSLQDHLQIRPYK
jgi:osmotically-inducible protein OsmY